jgi:hypothetical protein
MCTRIRLVVVLLAASGIAGVISAQITSNRIPEPIVKRRLAVEIKDVLRLPDTRGIRPAIRTSRPRAGRVSATCATAAATASMYRCRN